MRTTVTVDGEMVADLMEIYGAPNKTKAVQRAIREALRRSKLKRLASMLGKIDFAVEAHTLSRRRDADRAKKLEAGDGKRSR